jgi:hypothetical protein
METKTEVIESSNTFISDSIKSIILSYIMSEKEFNKYLSDSAIISKNNADTFTWFTNFYRIINNKYISDAFVDACNDGHYNMIIALNCHCKFNPETISRGFYYACENKHTQVVRYLYNSYINEFKTGLLTIHHIILNNACTKGNLELVKLICDIITECNKDISSYELYAPISNAISTSNAEIVYYLFIRYKSKISKIESKYIDNIMVECMLTYNLQKMKALTDSFEYKVPSKQKIYMIKHIKFSNANVKKVSDEYIVYECKILDWFINDFVKSDSRKHIFSMFCYLCENSVTHLAKYLQEKFKLSRKDLFTHIDENYTSYGKICKMIIGGHDLEFAKWFFTTFSLTNYNDSIMFYKYVNSKLNIGTTRFTPDFINWINKQYK